MILNVAVKGWIFIGMSVIAMLGAVLDWNIVSRPGKFLNLILGDTVARVIYLLAGVFLFVVGTGKFIGADWF
jgi:hypothetical protein